MFCWQQIWIEVEFITMNYSAYKKYSYPFIFSHFVMLQPYVNCFELLPPPTSIYTPYTIMTKQKHEKKNKHIV